MRSPRAKPRLASARATPIVMASSSAIGVLARHLLAAEIDDRELGEVAVAPDQVAEVFEPGHYGSSEPRYAASAIMSSWLSLATAGFISSTHGPLRLPVFMSLSWRKM